MKWLLYNALFAVAYAVMVPSFLLRMKRRGGYRARFSDRFGRYPKEIREVISALGRPIWIHAVFKHYFCYGKQVFWIGE